MDADGILESMSLKALLLSIERGLPPAPSARLRFHSKRYTFCTAMNGLTSRLEATLRILFRFGIRQLIETGTFRGTTTEWFAKFEIPVYTIESNRHNYEFAKQRRVANTNVHVELGNSTEVLPTLAAKLDFAVPTFIYLKLLSFSHVGDDGRLYQDFDRQCFPEAEMACGPFEFTKRTASL